ncbi:MAG TPA: magnesium transporter [Firmicutes bacterium]|jgi:magnesium transporter|nr:magnesium transporter [Bacillota bacterium]HOQ23292.1 magnesium transporter [Bacillota bacterium]HPT66718.1 magnesium transporter [Bacillota bacterium]
MEPVVLKELLLLEDLSPAIEAVPSLHPADVAEGLKDVPFEQQLRFINLLTSERAAEILQAMEVNEAAEILNGLEENQAAEILKHMFTDEAADVLGELPEEDSEKLIALMEEAGEEVRELLAYEEDTSGGLMSTEFITVQEGQRVGEVLAFLRKQAPSTENAYYLYVVNQAGVLTGVVSLRDLVISPLTTKIGTIMKKEVISVPEDMDQEEVARLFEKYGFLALPVVDMDKKLVGVITVDDVLDVAVEEVTEDIHKSASITPLETGYTDAGVWTLFSKRILWLVGLILVNLVSSGIIAAYEKVLASTITLVAFIPLLIGTGGNTGSQSATLIIRALVTGDVKLAEWGRVFLKELFVGICLGLVLGAAGTGLGVFRGGPEVGLVIGLTMLAIVVVSNLIGMSLPFILTVLRMDPAVASSPLITTISDASGLVIYFTIASHILRLQ